MHKLKVMFKLKFKSLVSLALALFDDVKDVFTFYNNF